MANRLDVVAIGIEDERVYQGPAGSPESRVQRRLIGGSQADPEVWLGRLTEAHPGKPPGLLGRKLHEFAVTQRRQRRLVECLASAQIADLEACVIMDPLFPKTRFSACSLH